MFPRVVRRFRGTDGSNNGLQPSQLVADITDMNTLSHLLPGWLSARRAPRDSGAPSSLFSRIEVRPPELWPSSLTLWGRTRRWLERSPWTPAPQRPVNRLALVKCEFRDALKPLESHEAMLLSDRVERARSLRELWHLRAGVYEAMAIELDQPRADAQMARLNRHFPTRAPRSGFAPLNG